MTTQHTHHEHNDVDQSVVEYPSTSETITVDSTTSENSPFPAIQNEATHQVEEETGVTPQVGQDNMTPSISNQTPTEPQEPSQKPVSSEMVNQTGSAEIEQKSLSEQSFQVATTTGDGQNGPSTTTHEEIRVEVEHNSNNGGGDSDAKPTRTKTGAGEASLPTASVDMQAITQQSEQPTQPEQLAGETERANLIAPLSEGDEISIQAEHEKETSSSFPYTEIVPLINTKAEEVRPFTEFIEEFRLAEAARLQSALRESQVEAFALLNPVETISQENTSTEKPVTLENGEDTEIREGTYMQAEARQQTTTEPKETVTTEQKTIIDPANRPVSPLLRPATRLRVPRHGIVRQPREEQLHDEAPLPTTQKVQAETKEAGTPIVPAQTSESLPPKPARRYRFDRPTSSTTNAKNAVSVTGSAIPNANGSVPTTAAIPVARAAITQDKELREAPTNSAIQLESSVQAPEQQEIVPEAKTLTEPPMTATPTQTSEQVRRRHTHKEQATPTPRPAVDPPLPVAETITQIGELAPEDLPPLEYSELQKASNSRRRRRHRSGSNSIPSGLANIGNEPVAPVTPIPSSPSTLLSSQMPSMPQTPATSPIQPPAAPYQNGATNGAYNIVSGYTLNQMNQGSEIVGPFMGPEPSPARGSVPSRDGRTTRAETQRIPIAPMSFASRPAEHGLHGPSVASMTQLGSIVSQAIQAQTDRIVTELRRANQAPTNVSVNLPPFPSTERVGVFVDVANLLYSARTLRIAVDFGKLLDFLRGNRRLVRAHAYCPTSPQPGDEQMFLQAVKGLGYRITTKNYKTFSSGAKKADLDLDLCMDVVRLVDGRAVDCIVLVSGDSDFMPMLDYCSDHGVRVEVAAFDEAMSATLRQSCDLFVNLSMLEEIRA